MRDDKLDFTSLGNRAGPSTDSYWVVPGKLAAGAHPIEAHTGPAADLIRGFLEAGIDRFIDLTHPSEVPPYGGVVDGQAAKLGRTAGYQRFPIYDQHNPGAREVMTAALDAVDAALAAGETAYVHCWAGVGRTGTVVGCWLVRHGLSGAEALERIARWRDDMDGRYGGHPSPNFPHQRAYVLTWAEEGKSGAPFTLLC